MDAPIDHAGTGAGAEAQAPVPTQPALHCERRCLSVAMISGMSGRDGPWAFQHLVSSSARPGGIEALILGLPRVCMARRGGAHGMCMACACACACFM